MSEANEQDWNNEFLHWAGRHCVAVGWEDSEPGAQRATGGFAFSGFIMSIQNMWFLVTAGHVIVDINARLRHGRQFRYAKIIDRWSEDNVDQNPIPFPDIIDQNRVPQGHVFDERLGIDYGWFYLRGYYRNLLAGNGIVAVDEAAWRNVPEDLQSHNAFGFPRDCVAEYRDEDGRYKGLRIKAQLVPYRRELEPPPEFQRQFPRLFFWPPVGADGAIKNVDGLSGAPVFGYRVDANHIRLWLVGIQSMQLEISRLAAVCPAERFGLAVTAALSEEIERRNLEQE